MRIMSLRNQIASNINKIKLTYHSLKRFQENRVSIQKTLNALRDSFQLIEEYLDDPRGSSALVLVFLDNIPFHLVLAPHENELIIINVYIPSEDDWIENFTKRRS